MVLSMKMETQTLERKVGQSQTRESQRKRDAIYRAGKIMRKVYDEQGRVIAHPSRATGYKN